MFARSISSLSIPSSSKSALQRAGFKSVADLGNLSAEKLSEGLSLPVFVCEDILSNARATIHTLTRPAAILLDVAETNYPICDAIDNIIGGGLKKGSILELSGPPGSPIEMAVINIIKSFVTKGESIIFVDMQNMVLQHTLMQELQDTPRAYDLIRYLPCHSLQELLIFMHGLTSEFERDSNISLIVFNSLSFPFHATLLSNAVKVSILDQIKGIFTRLCSTKQLTVVTTVQMATRLLDVDGAKANFDTGTKAILVPQLGESYLPMSRSYRVTFVLDSPNTGMVRLLSSPSTISGNQKELIQKPYEIAEGRILSR